MRIYGLYVEYNRGACKKLIKLEWDIDRWPEDTHT